MASNPFRKSVLIKTSLATDIQSSGGVLTVAGLKTVSKKDITSIKQIKAKAEVSQVVTVTTTVVPTGATPYKIAVYDPLRVQAGYQEATKVYSYTTSDTLVVEGATAVLQREYINAKLVTAINADTGNNHATAASLGGGTGITITDAGGYYPVFAQNMTNIRGANTVFAINTAGAGYTTASVAVTTAAVYSVGIGANLLLEKPVVDFVFGGNVISGVIDNAPLTATNPPVGATTGQNYDCFVVEFLYAVDAFGGDGQYAFKEGTQRIYADNGTGSAVTNLAGFIAFEREMHKLIYGTYKADASTVAEFFDQNFIIQGPLGAVPVTTADLTNKFITPYGLLNHVNINTQTIVAPAQGTTGLLFEQDATATDGAQYSPDLTTNNSQQFVVGKTAAMCVIKTTFTTVANIVFKGGFRNKEAYNSAFGSYTQLAVVGTGAAGTNISTSGVLASAAVVTTTSAVATVTAVENTFIVYVAIDGTVTCWANGAKYPIYSAGTTPLVFAAGTILVPFFQYTNLNGGGGAVPTIREFLAIPTDQAIVV